MKFSVYILVLLFDMVMLSSVYSQTDQFNYGFTYITVNDYVKSSGSFVNGKWKPRILKKIPPKKYVVYLSAIYRKGNKAEIRKELDKFRKKYYQDLIKYTSKSPNHLGQYEQIEVHNIGDLSPILEFNRAKKERQRIRLEYKNKGYEIIELNQEKSNSSKVSNTKVFFTDVKIDDYLYVDGHVIVKSKFEFFGYPYIVSEYQNLIITNIKIKDKMGFSQERFDAKNDVLGLNRVDFLPYKPSNKPLIDANFWVWTPKVLNPNSYRKEHYKIFNYPVKGIATITDNFGNKQVDSYFKIFNHNQKSDDYFWTNSILKNPKRSAMNTYTLSVIEIKNIYGSLSHDLKTELQKFKNQNMKKKNFKNLTPSIRNAELSFNGGDYKSAIELLNKTVKKIGSSNARIESLYAKSYFAIKNYDKSKQHLFNYFDKANSSDKDYQNAKKLFKEVNDKIYDELRRKRGY